MLKFNYQGILLSNQHVIKSSSSSIKGDNIFSVLNILICSSAILSTRLHKITLLSNLYASYNWEKSGVLSRIGSTVNILLLPRFIGPAGGVIVVPNFSTSLKKAKQHDFFFRTLSVVNHADFVRISSNMNLILDKVCMYEEMMPNNDNVESSLLTSNY